MPRFAANLVFLFNELDMLDRFAAAAGAGFRGVEAQFPYRWPLGELAARLADHGLEMVLINAPPGDYDAGERGLAALPGREAEFRASIAEAIEAARALGCSQVHVMAGVVAGDIGRERAMETFVENIDFAATACRAENIRVLIEALNPHDVPGYLIGHAAQARAVIDTVGHDNLFLQYDLYHGAMNGDDLGAEVAAHIGRIGHMQVASAPSRGEPDGSDGDVDFPALFAAIDGLGYGGWIGCEYRPRAGTLDGLGWAASWGIGAS